jgi:diacylglycerol kinase (ATP)
VDALMKAYLIYNPAAGQRDRFDEVQQVAEWLRKQGWEAACTERTHGRGDATTYAREAVAAGCDVVFAAGGDGTMSQIADGLVGTRTALAILPAGTGNVMARQLGLPIPSALWPHSLLACAQMLVDGYVRSIDVGRVKQSGGSPVYHFLCWSGIGFDAQVNLNVNAEAALKRRMGISAFIMTAFLTARDYAGTSALIRVDGKRVGRRMLMLVANNIQLYGAFMRMAPAAVLDDGLLDVYCFRGSNVVSTALHAARLLLGQHLQDPAVDVYRAQQVEVRAYRALPVHVDAEPIGYTPVTIDVMPRALRLVTPRSTPATLFSSTEKDELS